jgi:hypothetical protein
VSPPHLYRHFTLQELLPRLLEEAHKIQKRVVVVSELSRRIVTSWRLNRHHSAKKEVKKRDRGSPISERHEVKDE